MTQYAVIVISALVLPMACAEVGTTTPSSEASDAVIDTQSSKGLEDSSAESDVKPLEDTSVSKDKDATTSVKSEIAQADIIADDVVKGEDVPTPSDDTSPPPADVDQSPCQPPCDEDKICIDEQCVAWDGTVSVSGKTLDVIGNKPVSGIEVCVLKLPDIKCGVTGDDGVFNLAGVPGQSKQVLTFNKVDYYPEHIMITTGKHELVLPLTSAHATNTEATIVAQLGETTLDPSKGHVGIAVFQEAGEDTFDQTLSGATFTMVSSATSVPLYLADDGFPDKERTESSKNSRAFFFNIEVGPGVVSVSHPDYNFCIPVGFGWPGPQASTMEVLVEPGTVTVGAFVCQNVPDGV